MDRKVVSVSFNKEEFKKLEEIKEVYNELLGLELNHSSLIKNIVSNYNKILLDENSDLER